jgi:hypothetical protein
LPRPGKARACLATRSPKSYIYSVAGFAFRFGLRRLLVGARPHHSSHGPMPLIECPECGQKVATVASVCPSCSCALSRQRPSDPTRSHSSWPVPVLVVVVLVLFGMLAIRNRGNLRSPPLPTSTSSQLTPQAVDSPPAETPKATGPSTQTKWTSTWVNVREGRGTDTRIVQVIDPGQRVEVDSLQGRWWVVVVDSESIGYIHNSVLQDESPSR